MKLKQHHLPGLVVTDHEFRAPLDYSDPTGQSIRLFAREVTSAAHHGKELPWLLFLQGGPGFQAPRPGLTTHGVLKRGLKEFRVLLLDQRGTGLSERVSHTSLVALGDSTAQAAYLRNFRADSIVKDAELVRAALLKPNERWTLVGQSYGGFIATSYLSTAPEALAAVLITGGLPPTQCAVDDVYQATAQRVVAKNKLFYRRYPDDAAQVSKILDTLKSSHTLLPNGDRLTPERFLQIGILFGFSYGFETVHYLIEEAFDNTADISYSFLREFESNLHFDTNPIYALLHEPIYCEGVPSNWSAARVIGRLPEFRHSASAPTLFTGEMIFPWMFEQYGILKPLRETANILAQMTDWGALYDLKALRRNTVPVAAAIFYDDMYVDRELSERTASIIQGIKLWVTNEFEHDAIRSSGELVLDKLLALLRGNTAYSAGLITS